MTADGVEPGRSRARVTLAYAAAALGALLAGWWTAGAPPPAALLAGSVAATGIVFLFSVAWDNSSVYDPFWSVAPVAMAGAAALRAGGPAEPRALLALSLVALWGGRLTWNWVRRWGGLADEDWRYVDLRRRCGMGYWPVSLLGIHLLPTLLVLGGTLPLLPALAGGGPLSWLDGAAALVTAAGIGLEARADGELHRYRREGRGGGLTSGLWGRCRHPNYLGELLFWWGLYLFGLASGRADPRTVAGPAAITLLFLTVSIPMKDRRMRRRHPEYARRTERLPALLPRLF